MENLKQQADMAELADALDSGSNDRKVVQVQVLLSAPKNLVDNFRRDFLYQIRLRI